MASVYLATSNTLWIGDGRLLVLVIIRACQRASFASTAHSTGYGGAAPDGESSAPYLPCSLRFHKSTAAAPNSAHAALAEL